MTRALKASLTRQMFRSLRLFDVPDVIRHMRFKALRQRYYDLFWARAAHETGATFRKWDAGFTRLSRNGTVLVVRGPDVRLDDRLTLDLMGNKALTYQLLAEQGLDVPRHVRFPVTDMRNAHDLLKSAGRPLVVKPNYGTGGGRGVTTGIGTASDLRRAAFLAARFDPELIAEEQIEGQSWRLLFIDGKFLDAVRRDPPRIVGDGKRSIAKLVQAENKARLTGRPFTALSPIRLDRECVAYLAAQDLNVRSVPDEGQMIVLKRAVNENSHAQNHSLPAAVHAGTIATCTRLVQNLGVRLAGIDILARNIGEPLTPSNGYIGEINTTPGLHHHDLVATPRADQSVAAQLVEHMFASGAGSITMPALPQPVSQLRIARA